MSECRASVIVYVRLYLLSAYFFIHSLRDKHAIFVATKMWCWLSLSFFTQKTQNKKREKNCPFVSFIFETTSATVSQQDMKRALMLFMERNYELLCNQYLANFGSAIMDTNEIIQRNFSFPRKSTIQIQMKKM